MGPKHHWTMAIFCILPFALKGLVQKTPSESRSGPANCARLPNGPFCTTCTKTTRDMAREKERYSQGMIQQLPAGGNVSVNSAYGAI